jgi:hypothetical protein
MFPSASEVTADAISLFNDSIFLSQITEPLESSPEIEIRAVGESEFEITTIEDPLAINSSASGALTNFSIDFTATLF